MSRNRTLPILIAALAAALSLLLAASAQAAQPTAGSTYTGYLSTGVSNGFRPPVSFKVSLNGKLLRGFKWAGDGCLGMGGPGDPWTNPYFNNEVGTINVSPSGTFSVKNVSRRLLPRLGMRPRSRSAPSTGDSRPPRRPPGPSHTR